MSRFAFRRSIALVLLLVPVLVFAGIRYWPTPRRAALARIEALDGTFVEQEDPDDGPHRVSIVLLTARPITEEDLAVLKGLRPLHRLLLDGSPVTDAGLVHIGRIEELELLNLTGSLVTDDGMVHLRGLRNLKMLSLRGTRVTDAGLVHLRELTRLKSLNVADTEVSDEAADELRRALPKLTFVYLHATRPD